MDNPVYVIAKSLIMPPGGLILLLLGGFVLVRGVLGRLFVFVALAILGLMSVPKVATVLAASLEYYPALSPSQVAGTDAQAILVLGGTRYPGAAEYGGDTVSGNTLQRLRYGAYLHRRTGLSVYVTAGSPPPEEPPLGQLMSRVLEDEYGVSVAGVEDESLTTAENAYFSAKMLAQDRITHVLLVTHAWHMPRAVAAFERAGIKVTAAPTCFSKEGEQGAGLNYRDWLPDARAFLLSYYGIHEWIGQLWYLIKPPPEAPARA